MSERKKTIVLLSAKRTGSTAMFHMFQRHPDVGVCHVNQDIDLWETNFWNHAAMSIAGEPGRFVARFKGSHPFLEGQAPTSAQEAFDMWERILDRLGPCVFDKSPKYILYPEGLALLEQYMRAGADVRTIGLIRDARDSIASQFELWSHLVENDSPERRERLWLEGYKRLEDWRQRWRTPVFRLEDLARAPVCYAPMILQHCGLNDAPEAWSHFKPVNIGRYAASANERIRMWTPSSRLIEHLQQYGYLD